MTDKSKRAEELFLMGYGCAQAILGSFVEETGLSFEESMKIASGFGGGMGRMREVCGTVSGMTFLAGAISPSADPANLEERQANYALVQHFAEEFRKENGDIVCRRLLGLEPMVERSETPRPSERTEAYYKKRPCGEYVGCAARIVAEYLLKKQN